MKLHKAVDELLVFISSQSVFFSTYALRSAIHILVDMGCKLNKCAAPGFQKVEGYFHTISFILHRLYTSKGQEAQSLLRFNIHSKS